MVLWHKPKAPKEIKMNKWRLSTKNTLPISSKTAEITSFSERNTFVFSRKKQVGAHLPGWNVILKKILCTNADLNKRTTFNTENVEEKGVWAALCQSSFGLPYTEIPVNLTNMLHFKYSILMSHHNICTVVRLGWLLKKSK